MVWLILESDRNSKWIKILGLISITLFSSIYPFILLDCIDISFGAVTTLVSTSNLNYLSSSDYLIKIIFFKIFQLPPSIFICEISSDFQYDKYRKYRKFFYSYMQTIIYNWYPKILIISIGIQPSSASNEFLPQNFKSQFHTITNHSLRLLTLTNYTYCLKDHPTID